MNLSILHIDPVHQEIVRQISLYSEEEGPPVIEPIEILVHA